MENKICTECNIEKGIEYFELRKDTGKYRNKCSMCNKGYESVRRDTQEYVQNLYTKGKKQCGKCKEIKTLNEFTNDKYTVTGKTSLCKICISNKYTTEEARGFAYKYRYGITLEDYKNMYILQEGRCDICKESSEKLVVDHCHTNGNVRGLLCTSCNSGLGFFKDNIANLLEASKYLIKNNYQQ
jgi:hypothetical protein